MPYIHDRGDGVRLHVRALMFSFALLWGIAFFLTGLANMIWSGYAQEFLDIVASVYPGYDANGLFGDLVIGTVYALFDGAVGGLLFGWFYNMIAGREIPGRLTDLRK